MSQRQLETGEQRRWVRDIVDWLVARGDAASLAAAALTMRANAAHFMEDSASRGAYRERYLALARKAAQSAPDDVRIQMLTVALCQDLAAQSVACDPAPFEAALRAAAPTNAVSWLGVARQAAAQRDGATQSIAIASMANSERLDFYRDDIEALVAQAVGSAVVTAPRTGQEAIRPVDRLVMSAMAELPLPTFKPVVDVCWSPASEGLAEECRGVARHLRNEKSELLLGLALDLGRRLAPAGSPEADEIAQIQRRRAWQLYHALRVPRTPEQNLRLIKTRVPDVALRQELLTQNGIPLDPPGDWSPPEDVAH